MEALDKARAAHRKRRNEAREVVESRAKRIKISWLYERDQKGAHAEEQRQPVSHLLLGKLKETKMTDFLATHAPTPEASNRISSNSINPENKRAKIKGRYAMNKPVRPSKLITDYFNRTGETVKEAPGAPEADKPQEPVQNQAEDDSHQGRPCQGSPKDNVMTPPPL